MHSKEHEDQKSADTSQILLLFQAFQAGPGDIGLFAPFLATNDIFNFTARSKLLCCPKQEKSRSGAKPSKFRPPQP